MSDHGEALGVELRCTLLDAASGVRRDVQVSAPPGATLDDLLEAGGLAGSSPAPVAVDGLPVPANHPLGRPPLLHGALIVLNAPRPTLADLRGAGLQLDVVAGPDAGRTVALGPGDYVLGRCEPADVRLDDPQVSRRHARLHVRADTVTVQDLGSTNGTWFTAGDAVAGASRIRLDDRPHPMPVGARLRLGRSTVELRVPMGRPASTRATQTGRVDVNRPPRSIVPMADVQVAVPIRPEAPARTAVPWVGMAVPLVLCLSVAWLLRQPTYLLFGLMSPLILAGTALADRLTRGRRRRRRDAAWNDRLRAAQERMSLGLQAERATRRSIVGDPALLSRVARQPGSRLWERTAGSVDLLLLSVGTGDVPSSAVCWTGPGSRPTSGRAGPDDDDGWRPPVPVMEDAPVTIDLLRHRHLGVCGDRAITLRLARWLIGQLTVWLGPDTVQVLVMADNDLSEWQWTRWLPHAVVTGTGPTSDWSAWLEDHLRRRRQELGDGPPDSRLVILLDGGRLAHLPAVAGALADGPGLGVHVLALADSPGSLPAACGAVVSVRDDGSGTLEREGEVTNLTIDGTARSWAETVARALAPLRDATPAPGRLPEDVALLDLLPCDATSADAVADDWRRRPRSTRAVVGRRVDGPFELDLATDGPHVLVGGTTGSGKSELLRTMVTSLAVVNRPDEMMFVLVDYKGGAAFRGCAELVHTVGLVTDLDEQLATRALDSLDSELRRRERLLADAGCRDMSEYQGRRDDDPGLPLLPRLVLVIDEFRALASELPDFLDGIVRVASLGRSLGVHVVLATQRPGGVVTADIKANVNLRICLRVRDRVDSDDVVDDGRAAAISPDTPGRALVRRGGDGLVAVQIARLDQTARTAPGRTTVTTLPDRDSAVVTTPQDPASSATGDHLTRIVAACATAARQLGIEPPAPVWTPPLPDVLTPSEARDTAGDPADGEALVGVVDLPRQQCRQRLAWHPTRDGHLAVSGASRTGRTSALLTIATGLVHAWSPTDLHLHVIDAGHGPLCGLAELPHTGTVVTADQPRLVARFVERLLAEVADRRARDADHPDAALVLLIDGWEGLVERLEDVDHGRPIDQLLAVMRDGESVGVRAIVTGGRAVLLSRVAAVVGSRLMLRPNDPTDLLLAGLSPSALPARQPPGRAVRSSDGAHVQIATPPPVTELAAGAARRWPTWQQHTPAARALRLRPLPATVDAGELLAPAGAVRWALVGCGGDDARAVGIDLVVDRFALVAGPAGSGRSTALVTMARSLQRAGVEVVGLCPCPSPLADGPWPVLRPDQLVEPWLSEGTPPARRPVLLVDDVDRLRDHPSEAVLCRLADDPVGPGVVAAGTTAALLASYRGVAGVARVHRTGVLLGADSASDGELLGIRAQLDDRRLPGRGLLVVRGQQTPVQVARTAG